MVVSMFVNTTSSFGSAPSVRRGRRAVTARAKGIECYCAQCVATPCLAVLATHLRIDNQQDPTALSSIVICNVKDI